MKQGRNTKRAQIEHRHKKIRARISGTEAKPRLSVFKSNTAIYGQLINDVKGATIVAVSTREVAGKGVMERARVAGKALAEKAKAEKITAIVFDRGGFQYTGQVKAFADGAREGGLKF